MQHVSADEGIKRFYCIPFKTFIAMREDHHKSNQSTLREKGISIHHKPNTEPAQEFVTEKDLAGAHLSITRTNPRWK